MITLADLSFTGHALQRLIERDILEGEVVEVMNKEKSMRCVICKHGQMAPGETTLAFTHGEATVVVKHIPADVCQTCGEPYIEGETSTQLLHLVREAFEVGLEVAVCHYVAA